MAETTAAGGEDLMRDAADIEAEGLPSSGYGRNTEEMA